MALFLPLRGIFYNLKKIGDLQKVVTPPYDVITPREQDLYYERHPLNIIRLILNKETPHDNQENNRYTRAAATYRSWLKEGVLIRSPYYQFYFLRQEFKLPQGYFSFPVTKERGLVRKGIIGLLRLEDYSTGVVLPHEKTQRKPKADRLALMEACRANFCQVFAFWEDKERNMPPLYERVFSSPEGPALKVKDEEGTTHALWMVNDPQIIREVSEILRPQKIYIADGHHRYETALAYKERQLQQKTKVSGRESFHFTMAYLTTLEDEGLLILPTHRVVDILPGFQSSSFLKQIEQTFALESFSFDAQNLENILAKFLRELAGRGASGRTLGMLLKEKKQFYLLTLKKEEEFEKIAPQLPVVLKRLDVNLLHLLIFQKFLNISTEDLAAGKYVLYFRDPFTAAKEVTTGKGEIAFFLNPPQVAQVRDVSLAGETMPSKSTFFYPKLLSGLVINPLEPDEEIPGE